MAILPLIGETEEITFTPASAAGDEFDNAAGTSGLVIWNQSAGSLRVEFVEQRNCSYGEKGVHITRVVTVLAGVQHRIPRFTSWRYNNANKRVEMIYPDGETDIELAALDRPCL